MELTIAKNQSKGMMGGISFEVRARVQLSDEERNLVEHYRMGNETLFVKKLVNIWGQPKDKFAAVTVRDLVDGATYTCKDMSEVIDYTDSLKSACENLKAYLEVARSFGGEEVYEID